VAISEGPQQPARIAGLLSRFSNSGGEQGVAAGDRRTAGDHSERSSFKVTDRDGRADHGPRRKAAEIATPERPMR